MKIASNKIFDDKAIEEIEKHYNGKYLIDSCLRLANGEWANFPAAFFWQDEAHPQGSNYFAIYFKDGADMMITDGKCIEDQMIVFGVCDNGELIHSRHRHDFISKNGAMMDGGQDYVKHNNCQINTYKIVNGEFLKV